MFVTCHWCPVTRFSTYFTLHLTQSIFSVSSRKEELCLHVKAQVCSANNGQQCRGYWEQYGQYESSLRGYMVAEVANVNILHEHDNIVILQTHFYDTQRGIWTWNLLTRRQLLDPMIVFYQSINDWLSKVCRLRCGLCHPWVKVLLSQWLPSLLGAWAYLCFPYLCFCVSTATPAASQVRRKWVNLGWSSPPKLTQTSAVTGDECSTVMEHWTVDHEFAGSNPPACHSGWEASAKLIHYISISPLGYIGENISLRNHVCNTQKLKMNLMSECMGGRGARGLVG